MNDETNTTEDELGDDWGAAMAEQAAAEQGAAEAGDEDIDALMEAAKETEGETADAAAGFSPAPVDALEEEGVVAKGEIDLDSIVDIPVTLSVEVGGTKVSIRNLLQLNQGSVVELDRLAGEPLDVLVNGTLVAHGEVVVVNEKFGVRLTDVMSPQERIKKLR